MTQDLHLVRKPLFRLRTAKCLVHPAVVADADHCSERILDLIHFVQDSMAQRTVETSLEKARKKCRIAVCKSGANWQNNGREFAKGSKSFCWRHGIDFAYVSDTPERKTWEKKTTVCGKIRRIRSKIDT